MNKVRIAAAIAAVGIAATTLAGCGGGTQYESLCVNQFGMVEPFNLYCQPGGLYYSPYYHSYPVRVGFVSPGYGHTISNFQINNYYHPSKTNVKPAQLPSNGSGNVVKVPTPKSNVNINKQQKNPSYKAPKAPTYKAPSIKGR
jgi:hypothetical protein